MVTQPQSQTSGGRCKGISLISWAEILLEENSFYLTPHETNNKTLAVQKGLYFGEFILVFLRYYKCKEIFSH